MSLQIGHYIEVDCALKCPTQDGIAIAAFAKITTAVEDHILSSWFKTEIFDGLSRVLADLVDPKTTTGGME